MTNLRDTHVSPLSAADTDVVATAIEAPAALSSLEASLSGPLGIALGSTALAVTIGVVLLAAAPTTVRSVNDELSRSPDRTLAAGFLGFFGALVVAAGPLMAATLLEHPLVTPFAILSVPGLLAWGLLWVVGGCLGAIAVGDRLVRRLGIGGESPSLGWGIAAGGVVLGASQGVPVVGALVAMGCATAATGVFLRRRFDVDGRLFDGPESAPNPTATPTRSATAPAPSSARSPGQTAGWEADRSRPTDGVWEESAQTGDARADAETSTTRWTADGDGRTADSDDWTVDDWEWETDDSGENEGAGENGNETKDARSNDEWTKQGDGGETGNRR